MFSLSTKFVKNIERYDEKESEAYIWQKEGTSPGKQK
jgi:hypothetical protein